MKRRSLSWGLVLCSVAVLLVSTTTAAPAGAGQQVAQSVPGLTELNDIWCGPGGSCLGVGTTPEGSGAVVILGPQGPVGPVRPVPGTLSLAAIACPSGGNCIAAGQLRGREGGPGVATISPDGTPGAVRRVSGVTSLREVACPTATTCLVTAVNWIDISTYPYFLSTPHFVVVNSGVPAPARRFSRQSSELWGIDCPTTTTCLAVGQGEISVLSNAGGVWSPAFKHAAGPTGSGYATNDISCPSASGCYATAAAFVTSGGQFFGVPGMMPVAADGTPGPVEAVSSSSGNLDAISCVGVRTCTLVGLQNGPGQGLVVEVTPSHPPASSTWGSANWFGEVSCVTAASCGMIGYAPGGSPVFAWKGPAVP